MCSYLSLDDAFGSLLLVLVLETCALDTHLHTQSRQYVSNSQICRLIAAVAAQVGITIMLGTVFGDTAAKVHLGA